jgi:site-specific DNA-methyltransferase (adenine-specific)
MSGTREPDVLEVISDLSSDEIFTPPAVANAVLDQLPATVWKDPTLRWLDPGSKTGVFLREATRRLMEGLKEVISNEEERLEHILTKMMFGIAITDLTALMSRRSLYLSKDASGDKSAAQFADQRGHVWMGRVEHNYVKGRCSTCRAGEADFEGKGLENHAYAFIHETGRKAIEEVFEMKFDVIVGNPPYQMTGGGGGTNDTPLYDQFVEQAKSLGPKYISMIIPSRWMAGGRGLDRFRKDMLADRRIRSLVDYPNSAELFPGVDLKSGVCYFFWDHEHDGDCNVTLVRGHEVIGPYPRDLSEHDVFIRDNRAAEILKKVLAFAEPSFIGLLTGDTPFGLPTNYSGHHPGEPSPGEVKLYASTSSRRFEAAMERDLIAKTHSLSMNGSCCFLRLARATAADTPCQMSCSVAR